jgi:hypothetical protein
MWEFLTHIFNSPAQAGMFLLEIIILVFILRRAGFSYSKEEGVRFLGSQHPNEQHEDTVNQLNQIDSTQDIRLKRLELGIKQLMFYSNAPNIVRIQSGLEYIHEGGNGQVEANIRSDAAKYPGEYAGVCALHPRLALKKSNPQAYFANTPFKEELIARLLNDKLWISARLRAFRQLIVIKEDARVWDKGCCLILENKEAWLDVLETKPEIEFIDEEYYNARLAEIRKRVYDRF